MKWRLQLVYSVCFFAQVVSLFLFWWYKLLEHEYYQWMLASVIFAIGIFSGFISSKIYDPQKYTEIRSIEVTIMFVSATFALIAAYMVFFPFVYLLNNNSISTMLIAFGVVVPSIYKFIGRK